MTRKLAAMAVLVLLASALVPAGHASEGGTSGRVVQRCVLFELFTGVNDTDCADDENATARLAQDYSRGRLAILEWFPPGDPLACPESQERYLYYGVRNTPEARMDGRDVTASGNNESQTYQAYRDAFALQMNTTPSAGITGTATLNGLNGSVNTTIGFTENVLGLTNGLAAYCFLYEDGVHHAGASNVSFHKYVVRKQAGRIPLTNVRYVANENVTANFSFRLEPAWNLANMGAVVVLQSDLGVPVRAVHQSALFQLGGGTATYGVSLSPPEQALTMQAPGSASVKVTAKNTGTATDRIDLSLTGPAASWGTLDRTHSTLAPGEESVVTVSIAVPEGTSAGGYQLRVRGTSHADTARYAESAVSINVQETLYYGIALSPSSDTRQVNAGDSALFQIRARNTGSTSDTADLSIQGAERSWADLSRGSVSLPPGGEETVTLTVSVPSEEPSGTVELSVTATSRGDPTKTASSRAIVDISGASSATFGVGVTPKVLTRLLTAGGTSSMSVAVNNVGDAEDTFEISKTGDASGWASLQPLSLALPAGGSGTVAVELSVPASAAAGRYSLTVRATSKGDPSKHSECSMTLDVQLPEEPPRVTSLQATPTDPTPRDIITVTASVSGGSIDRVELSYTDDGTAHQAQKMNKQGSTYTLQIGPFKAKTVIKYKVTAYTTSGAKNTSAELSVTVKEAPRPAEQTPGFGAVLALAAAAGAAAVLRPGRRRR